MSAASNHHNLSREEIYRCAFDGKSVFIYRVTAREIRKKSCDCKCWRLWVWTTTPQVSISPTFHWARFWTISMSVCVCVWFGRLVNKDWASKGRQDINKDHNLILFLFHMNIFRNWLHNYSVQNQKDDELKTKRWKETIKKHFKLQNISK